MVRDEVNMNNGVRQKARVKVEQINDDLFSDTAMSKNLKEQWMTRGLMIVK